MTGHSRRGGRAGDVRGRTGDVRGRAGDPRQRTRRPVVGVVVAVAALLAAGLATGACTGPPAGSGSPAGSPSATTASPGAGTPGADIAGPDETGTWTPRPRLPEPTTAAEVRDRGRPLAEDGPSLHLVETGEPLEVAIDVVGLGDERWTWSLNPDAVDLRLALLAAPEGVSFDVRADGSVLLPERSDARPTLGVAPLAPGTYTVLAPDLIEIHARAAAPAVPVVAWFGDLAVESATWGENEGGRSLAVVPTAWARRGGEAGLELVWRDVQGYAPDDATPGMYDQLACHALGAPEKASWNLEPWRPDVGLLATIAARCNPR